MTQHGLVRRIFICGSTPMLQLQRLTTGYTHYSDGGTPSSFSGLNSLTAATIPKYHEIFSCQVRFFVEILIFS